MSVIESFDSKKIQHGHNSRLSLRMLCSFTLDATPLRFDSSQVWRFSNVFRNTCVQVDTRVNRGDQVRKPKGSYGGHADVGEIPFEKSLERRRSHKWTRQPTPTRLPLLPPRVLLIAYARIRNAGYALAHARFVSKSQIDR